VSETSSLKTEYSDEDNEKEKVDKPESELDFIVEEKEEEEEFKQDEDLVIVKREKDVSEAPSEVSFSPMI